jgi:type I restriction enzyme S subunit
MDNNNTTYKDSPFGKIPTDWEVKHFEDVAEIDNESLNGMTSRDYEFDYISLSDVDSDDFKVETTKQVFATAPSRARRIIHKGDVLMSTVRPNLQGFSFIRDDVKDLIASTGFAVITAKKCSNEFLFQYLFSSGISKQLYQLLVGSNYPAINSSDVRKLKLPVPTLPEQKAIAHILSLMDTAISKNNQIIAQKELRKKWLMQKLLTGKKRLKGFYGEWKKEKLEKYLIKHDEKTTETNQFPVLTSSRRGIFLQSDYYTRDVASLNNTGYNVVPRGYFTYRHMSDDLIFKFNINEIVDKGIVSTLYPVFTVKNIDKYFLLCKLNEGSEFKKYAQEQKQGGSRTYVYFLTLCELKMNMPILEEQTAIALVLQAADKEIQLFKAKAEKLREQKKGLMQVLLTGKKRILVQD